MDPAPLLKVSLETCARDLAHQIAGVLGEAIEPAPAALSVFEDDGRWLVEALFEEAAFDMPPLDRQALDRQALAGQIGDMLGIAPPACRFETVPDRNWVALSQAALPPVYAGRFTVFGHHDRGRIARGPWSIMIDAGEAFGTAHHATTYGCLMALDHLARRGMFKRVLDLGTGSGVLAIALRRAMPRARIIATDLDPRSVEVARENGQINAVIGAGRRTTRTDLTFAAAHGLTDPIVRQAQPFDLVVANILAGPLLHLTGDIARAMRCGGVLVLSGILNDQAAAVIAKYCSCGFALNMHDRIDGWSTLILRKRV